MNRVRWSDNDRYFGPFTWSYDKKYPHWAVQLTSSDDEGRRCNLRVTLRYATLIVALPNIVRPHRTKVHAKYWDAETIARIGRDWYWETDPRRYGFSLSDGFLQVFYGRTGGPSEDSAVQQQWSCFLPWKQQRCVRHSLYGLSGEQFYAQFGTTDWDAWRSAKEACPKAHFLIEDFDGTQIVATTTMEEREWRLGTGRFKWLSWFRKPKIKRSLDIAFSAETGPEKGSWKGGTVGSGIDVLPGETHEAAFRRYCEEDHRSKGGRYRVRLLRPLSSEEARAALAGGDDAP